MKIIIYLLLIALLAPYGYSQTRKSRTIKEKASSASPSIYSEDGKYLGSFNKNQFDPNSISNPFGKYGSKFSPESVNNPFGKYGSEFSPQGVRNKYSSKASPIIISSDGEYLGRMNQNRFDSESISNPFGQFGSKYSPKSVNNKLGEYGNPYSPKSANNPFGIGREDKDQKSFDYNDLLKTPNYFDPVEDGLNFDYDLENDEE